MNCLLHVCLSQIAADREHQLFWSRWPHLRVIFKYCYLSVYYRDCACSSAYLTSLRHNTPEAQTNPAWIEGLSAREALKKVNVLEHRCKMKTNSQLHRLPIPNHCDARAPGVQQYYRGLPIFDDYFPWIILFLPTMLGWINSAPPVSLTR